MIQGLPLQKQQETAEAWIKIQMDEARALAMGEITMPKAAEGKRHTEEDKQRALQAKSNANPFFAEVKNIIDHTVDPKLLESELAGLKAAKLKTMVDGTEPLGIGGIIADAYKSFGETMQNGMAGFSIWDPLATLGKLPGLLTSAIWKTITTAIKNVALSYLSDSTASTMKALKHNYMDKTWLSITGKLPADFKEMTGEDAERKLHYENAARALAESMGITKKEELKAFSESLASQLDDPKQPWAAPAAKASSKDVAAVMAGSPAPEAKPEPAKGAAAEKVTGGEEHVPNPASAMVAPVQVTPAVAAANAASRSNPPPR
jgi:hypothetical protein